MTAATIKAPIKIGDTYTVTVNVYAKDGDGNPVSILSPSAVVAALKEHPQDKDEALRFTVGTLGTHKATGLKIPLTATGADTKRLKEALYHMDVLVKKDDVDWRIYPAWTVQAVHVVTNNS